MRVILDTFRYVRDVEKDRLGTDRDTLQLPIFHDAVGLVTVTLLVSVSSLEKVSPVDETDMVASLDGEAVCRAVTVWVMVRVAEISLLPVFDRVIVQEIVCVGVGRSDSV